MDDNESTVEYWVGLRMQIHATSKMQAEEIASVIVREGMRAWDNVEWDNGKYNIAGRVDWLGINTQRSEP